uniref:HipA-like C-terminal domain-containing protein n=1 Tax=Candidatus Kentrum sp. LFY TaxID=2126342 RepID=A0A450UPQ4_9GAMM|nr:MAG: HipA-like C-terminal domain-containing protein [Candidatus Kentron sp. LFY]
MFPIITPDDSVSESHEQLGTKEKYWLRIDDQLHLFKIGRPGTGENWAEKIAAELAGLLGLPHAHYDLATWRGEKGVLTPSIQPKGGLLVLGNESLAAVYADYPKHKVRHVRDHTLGRIHALLIDRKIGFPDRQPPDDEIATAYDLFLGYLLLDAWIANQDRHHENWGLIRDRERIYLAPTFDHAASMGQNETDTTRQDRLSTKDRGRHISTYIKKARSAIYENKTDKSPLPTSDLFRKAAAKSPEAARIWLDRLQQISQNSCLGLFEQLSPETITPSAKQFALTLLALNQERLLEHINP